MVFFFMIFEKSLLIILHLSLNPTSTIILLLRNNDILLPETLEDVSTS